MKIKAFSLISFSFLLILAVYVIHDQNLSTLINKPCFLVNNSVLILDQKSLNRLEFFKEKRTDNYPFVTGDTFRLVSDYVLDNIENSIPSDFKLIPNAKIFIKTDNLDQFFSEYYPNKKSQIILITHNSDYLLSINTI